jgi:hypothetical protein
MNETYQPIPVATAQLVAEEFNKSQVIILGYDAKHKLLHFTTYGVTAEDKMVAANMADVMETLYCDASRKVEFEDFRHVDAATAKVQTDRLRKALTVNWIFLKAIAEKLGIGDDTSIKVEVNQVSLGVFSLAQADELAREAMEETRPVKVHEVESKAALESGGGEVLKPLIPDHKHSTF